MKNSNNCMWGPKAIIQASGILNRMTDAKFSIYFHTYKFLLSFTKPLSTALHGSDMDVVNGYASVTTLTNELNPTRQRERVCKNKIPRVVDWQLLHSDVESNTTEEYWWRVVFLPFSDYLINQLEEHFKRWSHQALKAHFLIPSYLNLLNDCSSRRY